jgi:hypothetical protein
VTNCGQVIQHLDRSDPLGSSRCPTITDLRLSIIVGIGGRLVKGDSPWLEWVVSTTTESIATERSEVTERRFRKRNPRGLVSLSHGHAYWSPALPGGRTREVADRASSTLALATSAWYGQWVTRESRPRDRIARFLSDRSPPTG